MKCNNKLKEFLKEENDAKLLSKYVKQLVERNYRFAEKENNVNAETVVGEFWKDDNIKRIHLSSAVLRGVETIGELDSMLERANNDQIANTFGLKSSIDNFKLIRKYQDSGILRKTLIDRIARKIEQDLSLGGSNKDINQYTLEKKYAKNLALLSVKMLEKDGVIKENRYKKDELENDFNMVFDTNFENYAYEGDYYRDSNKDSKRVDIITISANNLGKNIFKAVTSLAKLKDENNKNILVENTKEEKYIRNRKEPHKLDKEKWIEENRDNLTRRISSTLNPPNDLLEFVYELSNKAYRFKDESEGELGIKWFDENLIEIKRAMGYIALNKNETRYLNGEKAHPSRIESIKSKNREIDKEIDKIFTHYTYNDFYLDYVVETNERVSIDNTTSPLNPMASKLVRAMIVNGDKKELKVGGNSDKNHIYMIASLQELGIKFKDINDVKKKFNELLSNIKNHQFDSAKDMNNFLEKYDYDFESLQTFHVLNDLKKYSELKKGDIHKTFITVEADATNSGLSHALLNMGIVNKDKLKHLKLFAENDENQDLLDYYEKSFYQSFYKNNEKTDELEKLELIFGELIDNNGKPTSAARKLFKSPIMTFIYGATLNRISGSFAEDIENEIYKLLEDMHNSNSSKKRNEINRRLKKFKLSMKLSSNFNIDKTINYSDMNKIKELFKPAEKYMIEEFKDILYSRELENSVYDISYNFFNSIYNLEKNDVIKELNGEMKNSEGRYVKAKTLDIFPKNIQKKFWKNVNVYAPKYVVYDPNNIDNIDASIEDNKFITTYKTHLGTSPQVSTVKFDHINTSTRDNQTVVEGGFSIQPVLATQSNEVAIQYAFKDNIPNNGTLFHIHDASISTIDNAKNIAKASNKAFVDVNKNHFMLYSSFYSLLDSINRSIDHLENSKGNKEIIGKAISRMIIDLYKRIDGSNLSGVFKGKNIEELVNNIFDDLYDNVESINNSRIDMFRDNDIVSNNIFLTDLSKEKVKKDSSFRGSDMNKLLSLKKEVLEKLNEYLDEDFISSYSNDFKSKHERKMTARIERVLKETAREIAEKAAKANENTKANKENKKSSIANKNTNTLMDKLNERLKNTPQEEIFLKKKL